MTGSRVVLGCLCSERAKPDLREVQPGGICCVSWQQASSGPACSDQAARPNTRWTKVRCAAMSFLGTARTWPLVSIAVALIYLDHNI